MQKSICIGLLAVLLICALCVLAAADTLTLPDDIEVIEEEAFYGAANIEKVDLPLGVRMIGPRAFGDCPALTEICLPTSLESIAEDAFAGSTQVTAVCTPGSYAAIWCQAHGVPVTEIGEMEFAFKLISPTQARLTQWKGTGPYAVVPAEVRTEDGGTARIVEIDDMAFQGLDFLQSVSLPDSVAALGDMCFNACTALESVRLPEGLTAISDLCFNFCPSLKSIQLPDSLQTIGVAGFKGTGLTEIRFPAGLKVIEALAFSNCESLLAADLPDSLTSLGQNTSERFAEYPVGGVFNGCYALQRVHYPKSLAAVYSDAPNFNQCESLKEITFSDGTNTILPQTFMYATGLEHVDLGDSITEIGSKAFYRCNSLKTVDLPEHLAVLGESAFADCSALTTVTFHEGLINIQDAAFYYCTSLQAADLPDSLQALGENNAVFSGCTSLTRVHYPRSLSSAAPYRSAFPNSPITQITFTEGTERILPYLFSRMCAPTLNQIELPLSVQHVGINAFADSGLKRVVVPSLTTEFEIYGQHGVTGTPFTRCDGVEIWCEYDSTALAFAQDVNLAYYYLTLCDNQSVSDSMTQGRRDYRINGVIRSNETITGVTVQLLSPSGQVLTQHTVHPNKTDYILSSSLFSSLQLELLSVGAYRLTLTAETAKSEETLIDTGLTVTEQPPRVTVSERSIKSGSYMRGTPMPLTGTLSANYPMELVTLSCIPTEGDAIIRTAEPNANTFDLSELGFDLQNLGNGRYTLEITVHLHDADVSAMFIWFGIYPQLGDVSDEVDINKLRSMLQNENNAYMIKNTYGNKIGALSGQASDGMDLFTFEGIAFSNIEEFAESLIKDIGFNDNLISGGGSFYKNFFKKLIQEYMEHVDPYQVTYEYKASMEEKLWNDIVDGSGTISDIFMDDNTTGVPDLANPVLRAWNDLAEELGNINEIFGTAENTYNVLRLLLEDFVDDVAVLESLVNKTYYTGSVRTYFQQAVQEMLAEYSQLAADNLLSFVKELQNAYQDMVIDKLMGEIRKRAYLRFTHLLIETARKNGAFDASDLYLSFLGKLEMYYAAERNFEELWLQVRQQELTEEVACKVYSQYQRTIDCAHWALKAIQDEYPRYTFMRKIDGSLLFSTVAQLENDQCPFAK